MRTDLFEDDWDDEPDSGPFDDDEYDDERAAARGTSECDGLCDPMCAWCLVGHLCPDECVGGECPYEALAKRPAARGDGIGPGWE